MDNRLNHTERNAFPGPGSGFSQGTENRTTGYLKPGLAWVTVVVMAGLALWALTPSYVGGTAKNETRDVQSAPAEPVRANVLASANDALWLNPEATAVEASGPAETPAVDGLKIASQSWRRGGLGSNALITFTLRNANDYAVKDIEIACAFAGRDGNHVTDRKRLIHDTVDTKSRKTFARMHVGFVSIRAAQAKCSLVTASRV